MLEDFPELKTERLNLIEIKQSYLNDYYKLFSDKRVTKFYNIIPFREEKEAQKYLDWFKNQFKAKLGIRWGIVLKGQKHIIGTLGYNNFLKNHRANLGYDLQFKFWNKGIITEALREIIGFGFDKLEINRIEAEVMQGNIASEKVLSKLGFKKEGVLRNWMYWNEKYYDMTMFSLLRSENEMKEYL